jgi:putative flippase GtrA
VNKADQVKLLRFCVSGLFATGLHVSIAMTLIVRAEFSPPSANAIAFACSTGGAYLLNTFWSFSSAPALTNVWRFVVVSLSGLALTTLVSHVMQVVGASPGLGIAMVVCVVPPLTFVAHRQWTYRPQPTG